MRFAAYALLFNRANVLSHSIGYNLYASERVLNGDVPYRDFHTLYPPAIFYLNAILFRWMGVSLNTALLGVLVFKVLTVVGDLPQRTASDAQSVGAVATLSALLWLRPNGPFKSVPMHYGALFLALAMYMLLKHENRRKLVFVFLAGASLGLVALFKHNIGAYALVGSVVFLLFDTAVMSSEKACASVAPRESSDATLIDKLRRFAHLDYRTPARAVDR